MAVFHSVIPSLSTQVKVNGKACFVTFTPKGRPYNYGYAYVSNPKTVEAIKKHPYYGKYITLEVEDAPIKTEKEPKVVKKEFPEVTKTQEAKEILKNEYGYSEDIRSKAAAIAAAEEVGVSFPNL